MTMALLATRVGLLACLVWGAPAIGAASPGMPPAPAPPTPGRAAEKELRDEVALLKQRLADLERRLEEQAALLAAQTARLPAPKDPPARSTVQLRGAGARAQDKGDEAEPPAAAKSLLTRSGSRVEIGGYAQLRATNVANSAGDPLPNSDFDFQVARFRPYLNYFMGPHWMARAQFDFTTRSAAPASLTGRDLYLRWQNHGLQGTFGQAKVPFGYEVYLEASSEGVWELGTQRRRMGS